MKSFQASELVLRPDKSVYHLGLHSYQLANDIIVVGDPDRVSVVSSLFDKIEFKVQNREIITHTGFYNGRFVTVMSTGMGPDNIDICMNELNVLASWDIENNRMYEHPRKLNIVRIGTSGGLQKETEVETAVASKLVIGIDNLLNFYQETDILLENNLADEFLKYTNWPLELGKPYAAKSSDFLLNKIAQNYVKGITLTAGGFYGPQFRELLVPIKYPNLKEKIGSFEFNNMKITNLEMETSALYGLGSLMGHEMLTICLIIANRASGKFSSDYKTVLKKLIEEVLYNLCKD